MASNAVSNLLGIPPGGASGQILTKSSSADYDIEWQTNLADALETEIIAARSGRTDLQEALVNLARYAYGDVLGKFNGSWYSSVRTADNAGTTAFTAERVQLVPYMSPSSFTIDRLAVTITANAGGSIRLAIYDATISTGTPSDQLWESSAVTTASNTGYEVTLDFTFEPCKLYWLAVHATNAVTFRSHSINGSIQFGLASAGATNRYTVLQDTITFGSLPATWSFSGSQRTSQTGPVQFAMRAVVV